MTTPLDPPAAAARRQYVLDRIVEHLVGWGCPLEYADHRAGVLLHEVEQAGWSLPAALQGPPAAGTGSTEAGRIRARLEFVHRPITPHQGDPRCACQQWTGPREDHPQHLAAMLVVGGVATIEEQRRARAVSGVQAPNTPAPVSQVPPGAHRGAEGVDA